MKDLWSDPQKEDRFFGPQTIHHLPSMFFILVGHWHFDEDFENYHVH